MCETSHSFCVVFNIPSEYHSKDLRNYFNELIESKAFNCFHFRHRPQNVKNFSDNNNSNEDNGQQNKKKLFCCVIDIKTERLDQLFDKFNDKFWADFKSGTDFNYKCFIKRIKIIDQKTDSNDDNKKINDKTMDLFRKTIEWNSTKHKNKELINRLKAKTVKDEVDLTERSAELMLSLAEVKSLRELNPPKDIMPNGNIGTPSEVFLKLIRECRLPPPVISKLDLQFPKSLRQKIYSKVDYKYEDKHKSWRTRFRDKHKSSKSIFEDKSLICDNSVAKDLNLVKTRNGLIINDNFSEIKRDIQLNFEHKSEEQHKKDDSDSDNEVEEWDRYETLHNDVTEQDRTKERLFEEEIELKWEKGGSGLVFYTDAQFWDLKNNCGDFDEKTADDWDVDTNGYRKNCSSDKDAIDLKTLREEIKLRKGKRKSIKFSSNSSKKSKIGSFEEHTKGFGRRIMESQGWTTGKGLGASVSGIPEPIDDCGQLPSDKRGFGYRGEKLNSYQYLKQNNEKSLDSNKR